jgi:hypothetical protein
MLNNDIMWLSSLLLFWGTMLNLETIQVNASTINDFLVILGTPWRINGLVNGGFACWLASRLVELLCGGFSDGWARREVKPYLRNMERSQRRRYHCSSITAYLLLNKQQHFKAVKFKYRGWASHPKISSNLAKQEQENINFEEYDPKVVDFLNKFPTTSLEGIIIVPLKQANISSIAYPYCFSSQANEGNVIIDSGASVCISPHRSDFITYNESAMKMKDLPSSNKVAGKGIIQWSIKDHHRESGQ